MALERTLCIIKPDAVEKKKTGAILAHLEDRGFDLVAVKKMHLTRAQAEGFYRRRFRSRPAPLPDGCANTGGRRTS